MNISMNKILSSLFFLTILWCHLPARTTLTPSQPSGLAGEESLVEIYFSSETTEVVGAQFTLQYDPTALEIGEILGGSSLQGHDLFDEQNATSGRISITLLSMNNKAFNNGILASISFTLLSDLAGNSDAISFIEEETLLVTIAGQSQGYEAMAMINELYLSFSSSGDANRPSTSRSVAFSADDDGSDATYEWDFGDGTVIAGKTASHTYEQAAQYLVTLTATNLLGSVETSQNISISSPYWDLDAIDLGNGWKSFDWFGRYYESTGTNWIYHENLGWLYRSGTTTDNTWLWSDLWQWGWVSDTTFPYVTLSVSDWLYYFSGTSDPVRYYDFELIKWLEGNFLSARTIELTAANEGGEIDGPTSFYPGQQLVFVARPAQGFVFAGWTGDYNSGQNPLIIDDARNSFSLEAEFVTVQTVSQQGSSVINLDHLDGESKELATAQLNGLGESTFVSSGNAPVFEFSGKGDSRLLSAVNAGILESTVNIGVFDKNAAEINHKHLPLMPTRDLEYISGQSRRVGSCTFSGIDIWKGIPCLVMTISLGSEYTEDRKLAQDTLGNVWILDSLSKGNSLQQAPTLLLPVIDSIVDGWKSWPTGYVIPPDHAISTGVEGKVRVGGLGALENVISLTLNRKDAPGQKEIFAKGIGLVQISLP